MSQSIVILGGTGFVGSHLVPRLVRAGHKVTLLSRNREKRRDSGVIPGVRVRTTDVFDRRALEQHFASADAVINLVGILVPHGRDTFQRVHVDLTATVIQACRDAGVRRLHQMSSLKAGQGESQYLKTRGAAEALVKASGLDWTIYEPSVIFGQGDGLVTRFAKLLRLAPVLPLARPHSKMAPVFVGDVVEAIARCVDNRDISSSRVFELYGPQILELKQIVSEIRDVAGYKRAVLGLPDALGRLQAQVAQLVPGKPFTVDNFLSLKTDSVGKIDGLAALGINAAAFSPFLPILLDKDVRQRRLDNARGMRR
jgi:NADH dehydrogenase